MNRRPLLPAALVASLALVTLSGCATFTDDDVIASVDGTDLDMAEFQTRYQAPAGIDSSDGRLVGDAARAAISSWIRTQLLDEAGILDYYAQGPESTGLVCLSLIRTADIAAAQALIADIEVDGDWEGAVAAADPADRSGGCAPVAELGALGPQLEGVDFDDPHRVLLFDAQVSAVARLLTADRADPDQLISVLQATDPSIAEPILEVRAEADVRVDPQFGTYDPDTVAVVPLG